MSKNSIIDRGLWEQYSSQVRNRMNNPKYRGNISGEQAKEKNARLVVAEYGAASCGDAVIMYWLVNKDGVIIDAKFESFGCGTAIASNDVMCELCVDKSVDEAVKITNIDVEKALRDNPETPAVPPQKMHCSVMAYDVIKKAAGQWYGRFVDEMEEIVCECARVSLGTIIETIKNNNLTTVEEIIQYTKAGGYCGSCITEGGHESRKYYLDKILSEINNESENKSFIALLKEDQMSKLDDVLNKSFRRIFEKQGTKIKIIDIKGWDVIIQIDSKNNDFNSILLIVENKFRHDVDQNIRLKII